MELPSEPLPGRLSHVQSQITWTRSLLHSLPCSTVIESLSLEQSLDILQREEKSLLKALEERELHE